MLKTVISLGVGVALGVAVSLFALPEKLTLVSGATEAERSAPPPPPRDRTDEVLDEVDGLREVLGAFATALDDAAAQRDTLARQVADWRAQGAAATSDARAVLERRLATIDARLVALDRTVERIAGDHAQVPASEPAPVVEVEPEPIAEPAPAVVAVAPEPATDSAPKRRSLAELLASRQRVDPRDELRDWDLIPGSCRVGFDGTSTIHNFTAKSEAVGGGLKLHFHEPSDAPGGRLVLEVSTLDSDNEDRDVEIVRHLAGEDGAHGTITCELLGLRPGEVDGTGTRKADARVRLDIHGVSREVTVPVSLEFTAQRLLHLHGEAAIRMSDFDIHPKAKLGLIRVDDGVTIWWDLYLEVARERA